MSNESGRDAVVHSALMRSDIRKAERWEVLRTTDPIYNVRDWAVVTVFDTCLKLALQVVVI